MAEVKVFSGYFPTMIFSRPWTPPRLCSLNAADAPLAPNALGTVVNCTSSAARNQGRLANSTPARTW
jgi:hypothetical protein